jgi:hypothetical protein
MHKPKRESIKRKKASEQSMHSGLLADTGGGKSESDSDRYSITGTFIMARILLELETVTLPGGRWRRWASVTFKFKLNPSH